MNDPSSAKIKTANIVGICNPRKFSPAKIKAHTVSMYFQSERNFMFNNLLISSLFRLLLHKRQSADISLALS